MDGHRDSRLDLSVIIRKSLTNPALNPYGHPFIFALRCVESETKDFGQWTSASKGTVHYYYGMSALTSETQAYYFICCRM